MARILVIDDDNSLRQMMSLMLRRSGHEAILAEDGQQGLELAHSEQPDMAIVDVMMPDLSGYDVCRMLRQDPDTMNMPLLILTALSGDEYSEQAQRSGADTFLTKPVTRDDLAYHVENLLATGATNIAPLPAEEDDPTTAAIDEEIEAELQTRDAVPQVPAEPYVVAVLGLSTGAGATTLAINLTLGLMQFGRSCLIDLVGTDPRVSYQLGLIPPRSTWEDLLIIDECADKRFIGQTLIMHKSGIGVIAAPEQQPPEHLSGAVLRYIYDVLAEGFRRIVVDLPSPLNPMTIATLRVAKHVVLVVGDTPSALQTAPGTLAMLEEMGLPGKHHIVINRTHPQGASHEEVLRALNRPIAADVVYEPNQNKAIETGTPLLMSQPNSLFSRAIIYLSRHL
ncbi:MAG: response regulator [Anaerolineae bacterium]